MKIEKPKWDLKWSHAYGKVSLVEYKKIKVPSLMPKDEETVKEFYDSLEWMYCSKCGKELKTADDVWNHYHDSHGINLRNIKGVNCWDVKIDWSNGLFSFDWTPTWNGNKGAYEYFPKVEPTKEKVREAEWILGMSNMNVKLETVMKRIKEDKEGFEWCIKPNKAGMYSLYHREKNVV